MAGKPWTADEVARLAREYFAVLDEELAGGHVNKNAVLRRAQQNLPGRTLHTLKDRCYRISEELAKRHLPWVQGWKPPAMGGQTSNTANVGATIWQAIEPMASTYGRGGGSLSFSDTSPDDASPARERRIKSEIGQQAELEAQTYASESEIRRAIENVAQSRVVAHFTGLGWLVEDTHLTSPYDARATKGSMVRYLEAKGTSSAGATVFATSGEVEWARNHPGQCVIGIVSGITFDAGGTVDVNSGKLRLFDWNPNEGRLQPVQYKWTPPQDQWP